MPTWPATGEGLSAALGVFGGRILIDGAMASKLDSVTQNEVLVLGVGFSRAISDEMPVVDEFGNLYPKVGDLGNDPQVPEGGFSGGSFETWLSRLAGDQPYLSTQENLENLALFLRFSEAIADVLGSRVQEVLHAGWPAWLPEFLRVAHVRRSTLATFNYDPLIEYAVGTGLLFDWGSSEPVFWAGGPGDMPPWPPGSMRLGAEQVDTFRLLKLHGSLNWFWNPGDTTGPARHAGFSRVLSSRGDRMWKKIGAGGLAGPGAFCCPALGNQIVVLRQPDCPGDLAAGCGSYQGRRTSGHSRLLATTDRFDFRKHADPNAS